MMVGLTEDRGFTLIELLVVIAIIGILAAAAVPQIMSAICDARVSSAKGDISTIKTAITQCQMEYSNCTTLNNNYSEYLPARIWDGNSWTMNTEDGVIKTTDVGCEWTDEFNTTGTGMNHDMDAGNFTAM